MLGLLTCGFNATALPIVIDGKSKAEIIIDYESPTAVEFAAYELQRYIQKITSAFLPVNNKLYGNKRIKIILGTKNSKAIKPIKNRYAKDFKKLSGTDGYAIRNHKNRIYIFADCPKGVLNGIYRFLKNNTDIIWPRPANELAIFTPIKNWDVKKIDYLDKPTFKIHYLDWNYSRNVHSPELSLWCARQGYSIGLTREKNRTRMERLGFYKGFFNEYGGGHNLCSRWMPIKIFGAKHPEFYMLIDGKRYINNNANLCCTNKNMTTAFIKRVLDEVATLPNFYNCINIMMEDQSLTCECDNCNMPITLPDGTILTFENEAFKSTRFFIFINKVAKAVKAKYPDKYIKTFGYFFNAIPPKVKLEDNIFVSFCPYIRNDKRSLLDKTNKKWKDRLDEWLTNTPNIALREYYYSCAPYPRAMADIAATDLRYLAKKGMSYVFSACSWSDDDHQGGVKIVDHEFWDTTACEIWTISQLMWDPFQNPQKLRHEYLRKTYGKAAAPMIKYYNMIRSSWLEDPTPSAFNADPYRSAAYYIYGKKLQDPCRKALIDAEMLADDIRVKNLVQANRKVFEKWMSRALDEQPHGEKISKIQTSSKMNFNNGAWKKVRPFSPLTKMGNIKLKSRVKTEIKALHDGKKLYFRIKCFKNPKTLYAAHRKGAKRDTWTGGDHMELFFGDKEKGYRHIAFDYHANVYDAILTNSKQWDGNWEVETGLNNDGWWAFVSIPLSEIGFDMLKSNKLKGMVYRADFDANRKCEHSTMSGGTVHDMTSFSEMIFDLE